MMGRLQSLRKNIVDRECETIEMVGSSIFVITVMFVLALRTLLESPMKIVYLKLYDLGIFLFILPTQELGPRNPEDSRKFCPPP